MALMAKMKRVKESEGLFPEFIVQLSWTRFNHSCIVQSSIHPYPSTSQRSTIRNLDTPFPSIFFFLYFLKFVFKSVLFVNDFHAFRIDSLIVSMY